MRQLELRLLLENMPEGVCAGIAVGSRIRSVPDANAIENKEKRAHRSQLSWSKGLME